MITLVIKLLWLQICMIPNTTNKGVIIIPERKDLQNKINYKKMPGCIKDLIEEKLFDRRKDLFLGLDMVFFDTTSIYFEGSGGDTLGYLGHSKDHRPDLNQMIVGAVLNSKGEPICCELWPGSQKRAGQQAPKGWDEL